MKSLQQFTRVSGSSIGKNATKLVGCEGLNCQFMLADTVNKLEATPLKTGSLCPLCSQKTVRVFDSRAEFQRAQELKMLVKAGKIKNLEFQVRFPLNVTSFNCKNTLLYTYVSDYCYEEDGEYVVEDVKNKNVISDIAATKLKHFAIQYGFEVKIVTR
jgi:hypothetical protein